MKTNFNTHNFIPITGEEEWLITTGGTVTYREGYLNYEHWMLAPGSLVVYWDYQTVSNRFVTSYTMPELNAGEAYVFSFNTAVHGLQPRMIVIFFDEDAQPIMQYGNQATYADVKVPDKFSNYRIELMATGKGNFDLTGVTIDQIG